MYEKIYEETEQLCSTPCPIAMDTSEDGGTSPYANDELQEMGGAKNGGIDTVDSFTGSVPGLLSNIGEAVEKMDEEIGKNKEKGLEDGEGLNDTDFIRRESTTSETGLLGSRQQSSCTSGFSLPEVPHPLIKSLDDQDSRLRGGVYFGYGLMNIIVSLIPPKLMKLANLFGFHGSRKVGLQALEYSCDSQDMKAPLARWVWSGAMNIVIYHAPPLLDYLSYGIILF